jgi:fatty acid synthase
LDSITVVEVAGVIRDVTGREMEYTEVAALKLTDAQKLTSSLTTADSAYLSGHHAPVLAKSAHDNPQHTTIDIKDADKGTHPQQCQAERGQRCLWVGSISCWALPLIGVLYVGALASLAAFPVLKYTVQFAEDHGYWAALPIVPLMWLAWCTMMCVATAVTSRVFMPSQRGWAPLRIGSVRFLRWRMVTCLINFTTALCVQPLRGTTFLVWWYRSLGACIGRGVYIDTTDVSDADLLVVGDDVAISEGVTICCHEVREGHLCFGRVSISDNCIIQPCAVLTPGMDIPKGSTVPPLASAPGAAFEPSSTSGHHPSVGLHRVMVAALQCVGLYLVGIATALAAYLGFYVLALLLQSATPQLVDGSSVVDAPAGYVVYALVALTSPLYLALLPPLLQVNGDFAALVFQRSLDIYGMFGFIVLFPISFLAFGAALMGITILLKWILVGRMTPGVVERRSWLGVRLWLTQRLMDGAFLRFVGLLTGSEGLNMYLRLLGARIGWFTGIWAYYSVADPDMLHVGSAVHIGVLSNPITQAPVDACQTVIGQVDLGSKALIGMGSVVMPNTHIGVGTTLGARAATQPDDTLEGSMLYMGAPAKALAQQDTSGDYTPKGFWQNATYWAVPWLQPFVAALVVAVAAYGTAGAAVVIISRHGTWQALLALPALFPVFAGIALSCSVVLKWALLWQTKPGERVKFGWVWTIRSILWAVEVMLTQTCLETVRGTAWYNGYLRLRGASVGSNVHIDTFSFLQDSDTVSLADGVAIGRNATVFGHVGSYRKGEFVLAFQHTSFGQDSVVGTRAVILPGLVLPPGATLPTHKLGLPPASAPQMI